MSDLNYSVDQLRGLGSDLVRLADDLTSDARALGGYGLEHVAHPDLVAALADFADDTDGRRAGLAARLDDLGRLAADGATALRTVDETVARRVRDALDGAA